MKPKPSNEEPGRMTVAERIELSKLVRLRAKVARNDIAMMVSRQLADFEAQLAAKYTKDDQRWAEITSKAEAMVALADKEIAALCREMGVPESFRPRLDLEWYGRGQNASKERRAELRRLAEMELQARGEAAEVQIDRAEVEVLTRITADGLSSNAARKFLETMPSIDGLMPKLMLEEVERKRPLLRNPSER